MRSSVIRGSNNIISIIRQRDCRSMWVPRRQVVKRGNANMAKSMRGTVKVTSRKTGPMSATPLSSTARGLSGVTPVGRTGVNTKTRPQNPGGGFPKMSPGGRSQMSTDSRSGSNLGPGLEQHGGYAFQFPRVGSAQIARGMDEISPGVQPGGALGINPHFPAGKVSGKRATVKRKRP